MRRGPNRAFCLWDTAEAGSAPVRTGSTVLFHREPAVRRLCDPGQGCSATGRHDYDRPLDRSWHGERAADASLAVARVAVLRPITFWRVRRSCRLWGWCVVREIDIAAAGAQEAVGEALIIMPAQ